MWFEWWKGLEGLAHWNEQNPALSSQEIYESLDVKPLREYNKQDLQALANDNFNQWNTVLSLKDAKKQASLYTQDATFLPTVSPDFKRGIDWAEDYFEHFLQKNPIWNVIEREVQVVGNDAYLDSGMYDFEIWPEDNRQVVNARFSFVWKRDERWDWKVIHHHSSVVPG